MKYGIRIIIIFPRKLLIPFHLLQPSRHIQMGSHYSIRISDISQRCVRSTHIATLRHFHNIHVIMIRSNSVAIGQVVQHTRLRLIMCIIIHMKFLIVHANQTSRPVIRFSHISHSKLCRQIIHLQ